MFVCSDDKSSDRQKYLAAILFRPLSSVGRRGPAISRSQKHFSLDRRDFFSVTPFMPDLTVGELVLKCQLEPQVLRIRLTDRTCLAMQLTKLQRRGGGRSPFPRNERSRAIFVPVERESGENFANGS